MIIYVKPLFEYAQPYVPSLCHANLPTLFREAPLFDGMKVQKYHKLQP